MSTARPLLRATWATNASARTAPAGGTATGGYGYGHKPPAKEWNWIKGVNGDWANYIDDTAARYSDLSSSTVHSRLTSTLLGFTVGGALAQRPVTGGIYILNGVRADLSTVGSDAPVFTFVANSSNYIWARAPLNTSRLGYADTAVTQVLVSPGTGYVHIRTVVTGPLTVTSQTEPAAIFARHVWGAIPHYFTSTLNIDPATAVPALEVQGINGASYAAKFRAGGGFVMPLISLVTEALGTGIDGAPSGTLGNLGSLLHGYLGDHGAIVRSRVDKPVAGGATIVSDLDGNGFDLAFGIASSPPVASATLANRLRMYVVASALGGGMRWLDTAGDLRMPMVGREGFINVNGGFGSSTGAIGQGVSNSTLASIIAFQWRQNHTYLIWVAAEPQSGATASNFTVTVSATVNGVAMAGTQLPFLCNNVSAPSPAGAQLPVIRELIVYTHTAADVVGNLLVRVSHGAGTGGSSITYNNVRMIMVGGFR